MPGKTNIWDVQLEYKIANKWLALIIFDQTHFDVVKNFLSSDLVIELIIDLLSETFRWLHSLNKNHSAALFPK